MTSVGGALGIGVRGFPVGRHLLVGFGIGTVGIAVTTGLLRATDHAKITGADLDLRRLGLGLLVFGVSAVVQEIVFRSLLLGGLRRLTGSAGLALVVSAALFGLVHLVLSADATTISVLSNTMGGLMYGVAFLRSGRIWLPVGVHLAWNLVQGTVLGFVVSGNGDYSDALMHVMTWGPTWLSGGAYGPEGSVFSLVGRAAVIGLLVIPAVAGRAGAPGRR
jgi:membrane protease YdiL (CAAX protease family)